MNRDHIMFKLLNSFEANNVRYLHFKSNTNLCESFSGRGDFDVLVDKDEIIKVERLISENNGKRHNPVHVGSYAGVDNWLVFDELDGNIYHLHLHYQLVTGKKFVKDYVVPWNELLFSTRVKDPEYGVYVTNPNVELLLLAFRSVLKSKLFDYIRKVLGCYKLGSGMQKEWEDMYNKSSLKEIQEYVKYVCPTEADKFLEHIFRPQLSSRDHLWLHRYVRRIMKIHRRYSGFESLTRMFAYKTEDFFHKKWNQYMDGLSITRKTSLQGGLILAFVGVDGAGKSTVSNEICKWMKKGKVDSRRFYMGTGNKNISILTFLINLIFKFQKKKNIDDIHVSKLERSTKFSEHHISLFSSPIKYLKQLAKICKIASIQKNNYKNIIRMYRYKLNGGICVLDRWPQIEFERQNDGPKIVRFLDSLGECRFLDKKIEKEKFYLGIVKTIKPDIIFRLNISLDTCMKRKPEHLDKDLFANKLEQINQIKYQGARILEINAEQPFCEEILTIKRILWKYI